jgi:hypothetical protein
MIDRSQYVAEIRATLETGQFLAKARADFRTAFKDVADFETRTAASLNRLNALGVGDGLEAGALRTKEAIASLKSEVGGASQAMQRYAKFDLVAAARGLNELSDAARRLDSRGMDEFAAKGTTIRKTLDEIFRARPTKGIFSPLAIDWAGDLDAELGKVAKRIDQLADSDPKFKLSNAIAAFDQLSDYVERTKRETAEMASTVQSSLQRLGAMGLSVPDGEIKDTSAAVQKLREQIQIAADTAAKFDSTFDLSKAQAEIKKIEDAYERMASAEDRMRLAGTKVADIQDFQGKTPAADPADPALSSQQKRLLDIQALVREISRETVKIDIDVRKPDLNAFAAIRNEIAKLEAMAGDVDSPMDAASLASLVAKLREMNNVLLAVAKATDMTEGEIERMRQAWARNAAAADQAGRIAQKHLAKTTLASQSVIRIIQDAPFGMLGITNNIQQFGEEFARLKGTINAATGQVHTFGSAMRLVLGGMFAGPMAISLIITLISTLALSWDKLAGVVQKVGRYLGLTEVQARLTGAAIKEAAKALQGQIAEGQSLEAQQARFDALTKALAAAQADYASETTQAARATGFAFNVTTEAGADATRAFHGVGAALGSVIDFMGRTAAGFVGLGGQYKSITGASYNWSIATGKATDAQSDSARMLNYYKAALNEAGVSLEKLKATQYAYGKLDTAERISLIVRELKKLSQEVYNVTYETETALRLARAAGDRAAESSARRRQITQNADFEAFKIVQDRVAAMRARGDSRTWEVMAREVRARGEYQDQVRLIQERAVADWRLAQKEQEERDERTDRGIENRARTAENRENARQARIEAERRRAEALANRMREARERAEAVEQDAIVRIQGDGHAARLAQLIKYRDDQVRALSQLKADVFDAAGNVKRGMQVYADAYNEASDAVNRAFSIGNAREMFAEAMAVIEHDLALAMERTDGNVARLQSVTTRFVVSQTARARLALAETVNENRADFARLGSQIEALEARTVALRARVASLGSEATVELRRELAIADAEWATAKEKRSELDWKSLVSETEARLALSRAIREESQARRQVARESMEFRRETSQMVDDANALSGRSVWSILGDEAESYARRALLARRAVADALNDENKRYTSQRDQLVSALADASAELEAAKVARARSTTDAARDEADEGIRAAQARYDELYANAERALQDHEDRKTAIVKKGEQERKKELGENARVIRNALLDSLGQFASASESLYSTWRSQREAELEREGVDADRRTELLNKEGKKRFAVMKGLRIAEAIANTISAGVSAWNYGNAAGGPILGGIMLAAALATGWAQIRQLRALQPDGSGASGSSGAVSMGGYTTLNGSVTAQRVADFETNDSRVSPFAQRDSFDEAARRMEQAAMVIEKAGGNLQAITTPATAEINFEVAARRRASLNQ